MSKTITVVYFSGTGHTHLMAEQIAAGARTVPGTEAALLRIEGKDIVEGRYANEEAVNSLRNSDAIIFGTPTYMGGPAAQFKAFIDAMGTLWYTAALRGKVAGGFSHSGSPAGDKAVTLAYLQTYANQLGMFWVGGGEFPYYMTGAKEQINRTGFFGGVVGYGNAQGGPASLDEGDAKTAQLYGNRIAEVTHKLT